MCVNTCHFNTWSLFTSSENVISTMCLLHTDICDSTDEICFYPVITWVCLIYGVCKNKKNCKKSIAKISLFKLINLEQFRNTNQKLHNFSWIRSGIFRAIFRSKWRIVFWSVYLKIHNWRIIQNDWSNERKWNGWTYRQSFRKGKTF